jgi:hypothetical protein
MFVCVPIKPASCGLTVNFPQFRGRPVKPQLPAPSLLEETCRIDHIERTGGHLPLTEVEMQNTCVTFRKELELSPKEAA